MNYVIRQQPSKDALGFWHRKQTSIKHVSVAQCFQSSIAGAWGRSHIPNDVGKLSQTIPTHSHVFLDGKNSAGVHRV